MELHEIDAAKEKFKIEVENLSTPQEYLKLPLISPTSNPLTWWSSHKTTFPNLFPVAMKYLCIPATSDCS